MINLKRFEKIEQMLAQVKGIKIVVKMGSQANSDEKSYFKAVKDEFLILLDWSE